MKREHNLLSNVKLDLVLQNWLSRKLSKRSLTLPLNLQLMSGPCRCVLHSISVLMTMLTVNIRFTKFLPLVNFFIGAASFTFLVRWLPWRAPCHQDGRIGM